MISWLFATSFKAALLLGASWIGAALLRRAAAAARHQIWTLGVIGALVLPLLCWILPSLAPEAATIASTHSLEVPTIFVMGGAATDVAPAWPWLAIVWAAGTLLVAVRLLRGHLAARRLVRCAKPCAAEALRDAAASIGLAKRVQLLRSESIGSPMTIGVLRPCVLLPAAADAWSPARLRAVLVHELAHVRRHDTIVQLAAQLACALYWWNPLAWLAAARLRVEREHACDDLVLAAGILPSHYAADLLEVARSISIDKHAVAICMVDVSWTEARLRRILDVTTPRRPLDARVRFAAIGLALASTVLLACSSSPPVASPPASRGTLSVGAPFVREAPAAGSPYVSASAFQLPARHGALDLSLVATEVQRRLAGLEQCYERRLATKPALAGTVVIHWVIEENGNVPEACVTKDTVADEEITRCVNALVRDGGPFPAPQGGAVDVSVPFVFAARR